jgi:hypothetical protein
MPRGVRRAAERQPKKAVKHKVQVTKKMVEHDTAKLSISKDGFRYAVKQGIRGGVEFEFASSVTHEVFAKMLAKVFNLSKGDYIIQKSYVGGNSGKDYTKWRVELDNSIPTSGKFTEKIELVAPVLQLQDLMKAIPKVFALIREIGQTADNTGLHMTLSSPHHNIRTDLDTVKLVTLVSEAYTAEEFHRTKQDRYAKMLIPSLLDKVQTQNRFGTLRETIEHFINNPTRISDGAFPTDKMNAMNFSKASQNLVEFRLPGGIGYEKKEKLAVGTVSRFGAALAAALDSRAFLKDYVKTLIRLYYDARPQTKDPLLLGVGGKAITRWLVKSTAEGKQFALVDCSDGPPQNTKEWADSHLVVKILCKENKGTFELLSSGEGSGWNPQLIENDERISDRRLIRIKDHVLRSKSKYKREVLKEIKNSEGKVKKSFFFNKSAADYIPAIMTKISSPSSNMGLPANHMARQYLGIHITPEVAKRLIVNPKMTQYLVWYYTDAIMNKRMTKVPRELLFRVLNEDGLSAVDYADMALSYSILKVKVPRELFSVVCSKKMCEPFTRTMHAGMKHHKLESPADVATLNYAVMLTKNPSKHAAILAAYDKLYGTKLKGYQDPEQAVAPVEVKTMTRSAKQGMQAKKPSLNKEPKKRKKA